MKIKKSTLRLTVAFLLLGSGCATTPNLYKSFDSYQNSEDNGHFITSYRTMKPFSGGMLSWGKSAKPDNPQPAIAFIPTQNTGDIKYLYFQTDWVFADTSAFFTDTSGRPNGDKIATTSEQQMGALTTTLIQLAIKAAATVASSSSFAFQANLGKADTDIEYQQKFYDKNGYWDYCKSDLKGTVNDVVSFDRYINVKSDKKTGYIPLYKNLLDEKEKALPQQCLIALLNYTIDSPQKPQEQITDEVVRTSQKNTNPLIEDTQEIKGDGEDPCDPNQSNDPNKTYRKGFLVYDPSPSKITLQLKYLATNSDDNRMLSANGVTDGPIIYVNNFETYKLSHWEKPERAFWTKPSDAYSLNSGVLVGHTFTRQSGIKTVADLIFAPIQAALPGVSQGTQTVSNPGKPDTTTTTSGLSFK